MLPVPLVSIGLPVFNGAKSLAKALDSLLAQDYANLEIIISDNGSTDATPQICRLYEAKDHRVRYHRSEVNRGSIWNFNRVFELSSGEYFMWAAHDDCRGASFVSACVSAMEQRPDAVLCQVPTETYIEGRDEVMCITRLDSFGTKRTLLGRYWETLRNFPATAIYGLYRASALRKTHMFQRCIATDIALIQELSIYGNFIGTNDGLFTYVGRLNWNTIDQDYYAFFGRKTKPWWYLPFLALLGNQWQRVTGASLAFSTKLMLLSLLVAHESGRLLLRCVISLLGWTYHGKDREVVGTSIYWRWLHNPNVNVRCEALYSERVIKPKLGWWH